MHAGDAVARQAVHDREIAADDQRGVFLRGHGAHRRVGPGAGIEIRVQSAVGKNPGETGARRAGVIQERAAERQPPAARLRQREDLAIRPAAGLERTVQQAGRAQAHEVGDIQGVEIRERAARDDAPVVQREHGVNGTVETGADPECGVERAVRVQPRQRGARRAASQRERAAHDNFPVRLHGHRADAAVQAGEEIGVERAVRAEPREEAARHAADLREITADDHAAVRLHRDGAHGAVHPARAHVET